jgi:hypothetical protein
VTIRARGDKIAVTPAENCPPEFVDSLRAHKPEILAWVDARAAGLPADCAPWLHIARQVLAGEWDGADGSTCESLLIGLRAVEHLDCRRAVERLKAGKV